MNIQAKTSPRELIPIVMSAWLVVMGMDFFLHAGLITGASMGAIRLRLIFFASILVFVSLLLVTIVVQNLV